MKIHSSGHLTQLFISTDTVAVSTTTAVPRSSCVINGRNHSLLSCNASTLRHGKKSLKIIIETLVNLIISINCMYRHGPMVHTSIYPNQNTCMWDMCQYTRIVGASFEHVGFWDKFSFSFQICITRTFLLELLLLDFLRRSRLSAIGEPLKPFRTILNWIYTGDF